MSTTHDGGDELHRTLSLSNGGVAKIAPTGVALAGNRVTWDYDGNQITYLIAEDVEMMTSAFHEVQYLARPFTGEMMVCQQVIALTQQHGQIIAIDEIRRLAPDSEAFVIVARHRATGETFTIGCQHDEHRMLEKVGYR